MRLKYGPLVTVAQESITDRLLIDQGIIDPDFMPTVLATFPEESPVLALLDVKGYKTKGINYSTNALVDGGNYTTVSSNHVQYRIAYDDMRKEHFRSNVNGICYKDDANPTKPGLNKQPFYIFLDSNWIGGHDVMLLADGKTHLWVDNERGGEPQPGGVFRYKVKVDGERNDEYVDPLVMQDSTEVQYAYNKQKQNFSEFGNERYTFGGFGDAYLTLQRFKYSYSGTAAAMDKNKGVKGRWIQNGGNKKDMAFLPYANEEMLKWTARSLEFQLLEGKGTVSRVDKKITLTDERNAEVLSGNGIMYSGDGPIEYPMNNGWTPIFVENLYQDIVEYILPDEDGKREFVMLMPQRAYLNWTACMIKMGVTMDMNIEGVGDEKIINHTYGGFSYGGYKAYVHEYKRLSRRPGIPLKDGTMSNEWDVIIIPLGKTRAGNRGIELIQLRPMVRGTVAGIDKGGNVSSSVDGSSEHVLIQNGVVSQNQIFKLYRPLKGNVL